MSSYNIYKNSIDNIGVDVVVWEFEILMRKLVLNLWSLLTALAPYL